MIRRPTNLFRSAKNAINWRFHLAKNHIAQNVSVSSIPEAEPLFDTFARRHNYLRISLTERCNLRCTYCMPAEGVELTPRDRLLSNEELFHLVRVFASLGVEKIRLTGGEPTLRKDLAEIISELKSIDGIKSVSITTNGVALLRRLPQYQRSGLDAINISLDSLKPDRFEKLSRRPALNRVLAGIDLALQLGYQPLKINTVLMKGVNDDELCDFTELTRDRNIEVRFIEFMPFAGNEWKDDRLLSYKKALRIISEKFTLQPQKERDNDTARLWQASGHVGRVGFIASMSAPFCGTCNRMRLTADGNLKVCLFGSSEVSLRDAIRAGATPLELQELIRVGLSNKKKQHAGMQNLAHMKNRPMILIGG